jgi:hypothetical protein
LRKTRTAQLVAYVNHPTLPLDSTIAMVNLDMVVLVGPIMVDGLGNAPSSNDLNAVESSTLAPALRSGTPAPAMTRRFYSGGFQRQFFSDSIRTITGRATHGKIDAAGERQWPTSRGSRPPARQPATTAAVCRNGQAGSARSGSAGEVSGYGRKFRIGSGLCQRGAG